MWNSRVSPILLVMIFPCFVLGQNLNSEYLGALRKSIESEQVAKADSLIKLLPTFAESQHSAHHRELADLSIRHLDLVSKDFTIAQILSLVRLKFHELESFHECEESQLELLLRAVSECRVHSQVDSMQHYLVRTRNLLDQFDQTSFLESTYYYEFARYAYLRHDFEGSLSQLRLGLNFIETQFPDRVQTRLLFLNGIGIGLRRLGRFQEATDHHLKTLQYIQQEDAESPWVGNVLNNLGLCYNNLGQNDRAVEYQKQAVHAYQKLGSVYQDQIATGLANIGLSYSFLAVYDSAKHYSSKSLSYMHDTFGKNYSDILLPTGSLARIHQREGNLIVADSFISVGLEHLSRFGWTRDTPTGTFYLDDALTLFNVGMEIRQDLIASKTPHLNDIFDLKYARGLIATLDYAFYDVQSDYSRSSFLESHRGKLTNAVRQYYAAYQQAPTPGILNEALNTIEKYKSYQLSTLAYRDRIGDTEVFQKLNHEHRELLADIRNAQQEYVLNSKTDTTSASLAQALEGAKVELQLWQEKIKVTHPQYVGIVRQQDDISISSVRENLLRSNQAMVSYFLDSSQVYILTVSHAAEGFSRVDSDSEIAASVSAVAGAITDVVRSGLGNEELYFQNLSTYIKHAEKLYHLLLGHISSYAVERLIIIPDGVLWNLPFDLLLSDTLSNPSLCSDFPYAMRTHAIGYSYSLHLWAELAAIKHQKVAGCKIMAPEFNSKNNNQDERGAHLKNLIYSGWEASQIADLLGDKAILGTEATVPAFLHDIDQQRIIHLSTHAKIDSQSNLHYLAFSDQETGFRPMTTTAIYALDLQAELVTLSACESGAGQFEQGAGLISLSRAFSYAGARSLISSLWPVSDRSTSLIMEHLYANLLCGQPKDIALQNAKLSYLSNTDHIGAHPFLWGGLITIGVADPIFRDKNSRTLMILGAGLLLLIVMGFLIRKST